MRRLLALAALLLALTLPGAAHADERILQYLSDVAIQPDASLLVTETIDVRAEGNQIRRGIYRDFPTRYREPNGRQVNVGFDLLGVTRDGQPEPHTRERMSNGVRIRIGSPDVLLAPGTYRYVIRYRTDRQLGRFERHDELYWNATGNGWAFPIDLAVATFRLPKPVRFGQRSAYTGAQGSRDSHARVITDEPGVIAWQTTAPLGSYEGLTVAAAFPKGVLPAPSDAQQARWWLADWAPIIAGAAALVLVLGYYYIAWKRAGRGPLAGTVVPLFSPPDSLSPAAMRYVSRMGSDDRTVVAALVDLGVRGKIRMEETDGGWFGKDKTRLVRLPDASFADLPEPEARLAAELFAGGDEIVIEQKNYKRFQAARTALGSRLKDSYEDVLFVRNWRWSLGGLAWFAALFGATAGIILIAEGDPVGSPILVVASGAFVVAWLLYRASLEGSGGLLLKIGAAAAAVVGVGAAAIIIPLALQTGRLLPLLLPLLSLPVVISAFWWMAAPTREGRRVMDRIAGFKQYLSIAERERLDRLHPPEADTPELFEKYLPYAIALGVETRWARRFQGVLEAAAADPSQRRGFGWYSGSRSPWTNTGAFTRTLGAGMVGAISSASASPGSRSGSSGGGFSGGGGGGGGGGGW